MTRDSDSDACQWHSVWLTPPGARAGPAGASVTVTRITNLGGLPAPAGPRRLSGARWLQVELCHGVQDSDRDFWVTPQPAVAPFTVTQ